VQVAVLAEVTYLTISKLRVQVLLV